MLHELADDGGYVALQQAAEDREGWRHRESMSKPVLQQNTTEQRRKIKGETGEPKLPEKWQLKQCTCTCVQNISHTHKNEGDPKHNPYG